MCEHSHGAWRIVVCFAFFAICSLAAAADKGWIEVRSPHFRVLSDGGEKDARRVVREFEQIRAVFAMTFPALRLDSGAPLLVLAPRDELSMKALLPRMWKQKGAKPAGLFSHGWEKQFAVVRLDEMSPEAYEVVYHEYAHTLLHLNLRWLPVWLDEGLAEFYAGTRFEQNKLYIGAPVPRAIELRFKPLIPIGTLIAVTQASPYYHDEDKVQMFYAESWALTHFLMFSPAMDQGKRFRQFITLLDQGVEQKKAFQDAIGDFKLIDKDLVDYTRRFTIQAMGVKNPPNFSEKDFTFRQLTAAETQAELGAFHLWDHDLGAARAPILQALSQDPNLALAHEDMGFLDFADGKDEEAAHEFDQAFHVDGKLYLSAYYHAMLSSGAHPDATAEQAAFHDAMLKVLDINPQFAPAYVQLARLDLRQGKVEQALGLSRKAEELEPSRAGYRILTGNILQLLGRNKEAAAFAKYVSERWAGPDHDEALELWNRIPAADRPAGDAPAITMLLGTELVSGTLKSAVCGDKDAGLKVVIEHDGQALTFQTKTLFRGGFSDTLWYGEDHFSFCRHVNGLRTVIRYKPSADKSYAGDLVELDYRDDLPLTASSSKGQEATSEKKPQ